MNRPIDPKTGRPVSIMVDLYLSDGVTLALDAATANGVSETLLRNRLRKGESPDFAVRPVERRKPSAHAVPYDHSLRLLMGEVMPSLRKAKKRADAAAVAADDAATLRDRRMAERSELRAQRRDAAASARRWSAVADTASGTRRAEALTPWSGYLDAMRSIDARLPAFDVELEKLRKRAIAARKSRDRAQERARDFALAAGPFLHLLKADEPLRDFIAQACSGDASASSVSGEVGSRGAGAPARISPHLGCDLASAGSAGEDVPSDRL